VLIYLSALVALIGLIVYFASNSAKVAEAGRIAFFGGLLAFLLSVADRTIGIR